MIYPILQKYDKLSVSIAYPKMPPELSEIEIRSVESLANGMSAKEFAEAAGIKLRTAEDVIRRSRAKLGAKNAPQLVAKAYELGFLKLPVVE